MSSTPPSSAALPLADVPQLMQWLLSLTQPNTETIRQAEAALKPILKKYTSMELLWYVITSDTTTTSFSSADALAVRHVATIVLRKRLPGHYGTLSPERQRDWQTRLLQQLATEPVRPVRTGLLGVAATCAAADSEQPPPPVLQFVSAAAASPDPTARTLLFQLLEEMTDSIGTHWKDRVQDLYHLYHTVLSNPQEVAAVQCQAVKSLGQLLSFWVEDEDEMGVLAPLLPLFLQVAAQHAQAPVEATHDGDDDDLLTTVLDVMYDISYSTAASLTKHFALQVQFALSCLQAKHLSLRVRDAAALVIATLAESKSKLFGRQPALLGSVLDTLFQLMQDSPASAAGALFESNPSWRQDLEDATNEDLDDDYDAPTETSMAQGTLDMMACEIPKKYIWPAGIQRCLAYMQQENPAARKAGVAGLGVIAEGCAEPLTAALPEIMPYIFRACADASPQVRECACFCLGQISEHCQPDILEYATQVLPIIFALLDDGSIAVQATSCYVLEMFCERLEPAAVRPVLDQLVRKLAMMLESTTTKRSVQEMAVAAMAATAVAAEEEFVPYVAGVAAFMVPRMAIAQESLYSLRGRALECMGHMAIAVGKEHFRPYFTITMQCAMEGLTLNSTELQEFAYAVFANLAKVMGDEFAPALPDLVPFLIQVIDQDEGEFERRTDDKADGFKGLDDSDNDDDEDDDEGNLVLHVRTALLEVKKGAITALGEMAAHTGTSFCPFIESSMQVMQKAASNWHPLVKTEAADAMPSFVVPSIAAYHNGTVEWKKGDVTGTQHGPPLSQHTATIAHAVLLEEIALMKDDESATVAKACEAVQSVIEICGPVVVMPVLNELLSATHELLIQVAPCQSNDAQLYDAGHGEVDDDDHDATTQAACDLIGALSRVLGSKVMGPFMPQFLPPIMDYAKSSRPTADRAMAIGCLGEIAQEFNDGDYGVGILDQNWSTVFLPCIVSTLPDRENDHVQRNAAFCAGVCAEALRERMSMQDCQTLLQHLGPLFTVRNATTESAMACVDNAAAAVARIIMFCPPTYVPLGQVLPVLLSALPLKTDMTENETVYNCLLGLWNMMNVNADVNANRNELQRVLTQACLADSNVDEEIRKKIRTSLQAAR